MPIQLPDDEHSDTDADQAYSMNSDFEEGPEFMCKFLNS